MLRHLCSVGGILLFIYCQTAQAQNVSCASGASTFTCQNSNIVNCSLLTDGINDCGDNSDEGVSHSCGQSSGVFKCGSVAACIPLEWVAEGSNRRDCSDGSDEAKLINSACAGVPANVDCNIYIAFSQCSSAGVCECLHYADPGYRGTTCDKKIYGDSCSIVADCTLAYPSLTCDTTAGTCICNTGYYLKNSTDAICTQIGVGDPCRDNADCTEYMPDATFCNSSSQCECGSLYLPKDDLSNCRGRFLNESCTLDAQCLIDLPFSECSTSSSHSSGSSTGRVCDCRIGAYMNTSFDGCERRKVGEECVNNSYCSEIRNGYCNATPDPDVCACLATAPYADVNNWDCAMGISDLYCEGDTNCTMHFVDTICFNSTCHCPMGYYEDLTDDRSCHLFKLGSTGCVEEDCRVSITNGDCDSSGTCVCNELYTASGDNACTYSGQNASLQMVVYIWAIMFLVIACLIVVALVVLFILAKPWQKPASSKEPEVVSERNYGLQNGKPVWSIRPRSGNPVMYENERLQAPVDPDVHAFFNGQLKSTSVKATAVAQQLGAPVFQFHGEKSQSKQSQGKKTKTKTALQNGSRPISAPIAISTPLPDEPDDRNQVLDSHKCNFNTGSGPCEFMSASYEEMRNHKKETGHFIRQPYTKRRRGNQRKRVSSAPLDNIQEEDPASSGWTDEDDEPLIALQRQTNNFLPTQEEDEIIYSSAPGYQGQGQDDFREPLSPRSQSVLDARPPETMVEEFVPLDEPMDTTNNSFISDIEYFDENGKVLAGNRAPSEQSGSVNISANFGKGVLSPNDLSFAKSETQSVKSSKKAKDDSRIINDVAKANSNEDLDMSTDEDEDEESEDEEEAGGADKPKRAKSAASKKGEGKKKKKDGAKKEKKGDKKKGKKKGKKS